jgi:hypothetical protein
LFCRLSWRRSFSSGTGLGVKNYKALHVLGGRGFYYRYFVKSPIAGGKYVSWLTNQLICGGSKAAGFTLSNCGKLLVTASLIN